MATFLKDHFKIFANNNCDLSFNLIGKLFTWTLDPLHHMFMIFYYKIYINNKIKIKELLLYLCDCNQFQEVENNAKNIFSLNNFYQKHSLSTNY